MKVTAVVPKYMPRASVGGGVVADQATFFEIAEYEARRLRRTKEWVWKKVRVLSKNARNQSIAVDSPTMLYCYALHDTRLPPIIQELAQGDVSVEEAFLRAYIAGVLAPGVIHVPRPIRGIAGTSQTISFP